jgi:hypothetical protein
MTARAEVRDRPRPVADWDRVERELDDYGCAVLERVLSPAQCHGLAELYPDESRFRSRVVMARHGFGRGEYKYFSYPLPGTVAALRESLYPALADVANRWNEQMGIEQRFPADHAAWLKRCHAGGQMKPTPLLLQYGAGDYNCLQGTRGVYRVNMRHGVSRLRGGARHTLGIIFHDAK